MNLFKTHHEINDNSSLVVGIFEGERILRINPEVDEYVKKLIEKEFVKTDLGAVNTFYIFDKSNFEKLHIIGLGKRKDFNHQKQAEAYKTISYKLDKKITIIVDSFMGDLDVEKGVMELILTTNYQNYAFDKFKAKKTENEVEVNYVAVENVKELIEESLNISNAIKNTRDLVNLPYNHLNALALANYTKDLVADINNENVELKIYNKKEIQEMGMTAFLAVNQGSKDEPFLIHIKYQGKDKWADPVGLVGKGLMYDTGGYSLKSSMNTMKCDMAGAATVLGVFEACARNEKDVNLNVVIAATDNRVNGGAYLPDDIIEAMNKKTIEIVSTDAEGRLTLADALTFVQQKDSKTVIDVATLTGAIGVALGENTTGVFTNDDELVRDFLEVSKESNESAWHMPITPDIKKSVRNSKVADLTNSTGRYMGASGAAAFLEEFVEEGTKWIHLDVAYTAFDSKGLGGTGAMVKTIYNFITK